MIKMKTSLRTHTCGELTAKDVGTTVSLCGWVQSRRDHGGVIFIDLRDRYGLTQIVFDPRNDDNAHSAAEDIRREFVLRAHGKVRNRAEGMVNPKMATGEIEVITDAVEVLSKSEMPPFEIEDNIDCSDDVRLKYRYLDLRRPQMRHNMIARHKIAKLVRDYFDGEGFIEIETPMIAKSTPEGARDYLVPSRKYAGQFYALPQSPQIFKQLCMVAGFDRYCQIVRCFRDEDLRADRQPEFTQIDIEMSFIQREDLFKVIEGMMKKLIKETKGIDIKVPIRRIAYDEAMALYGSDKPDLRFGLPLADVTGTAHKSDYNIFKNAELVKCLKVSHSFSRNEIDEFTTLVSRYGAKGLSWTRVKGGKFESGAAKFLAGKTEAALIKELGAKDGETLMFVAGPEKVVNDSLANLRLKVGSMLGQIDDTKIELAWIVDFPLMEWSDEEQRWVSMHHPFTRPLKEDEHLLDKSPEKARSNGYDLVMNGNEIAGGSIRINEPELQAKIFKALGLSKEQAEEKFGFLMGAFRYGAPPHGGIAFGLDRLVALLTGNDSIREVIAFPKNKNAQDLMMGSPNSVDDKQLRELHIKLDMPKK